MIELPLTQGSNEWKAWRDTVITATDSAVILGISPFKNPAELLGQKLGQKPRTETNDKMAMGNFLEPIAREKFNEITGLNVVPKVGISKIRHWMAASFDGVSACNRHAVEIKCSLKIYEKALKGIVDPIYYAQMQHQLSVLDIYRISFFSYWEGKHVLIEFDRDDAFMNDMIVKEKEFYNLLMENIKC